MRELVGLLFLSFGVLLCSGGTLVSFNQFSQAITSNGYPGPNVEQFFNFNKYAQKVGHISTVEELAMALAQILQESDGLRARHEYACTRGKQASSRKCKSRYSQRGCDVRGQSYYGRGYMQLTWCSNYALASQDLYGDNRLVFDPDLVASEDEIAWETAFWVWAKKVHGKPGVSTGKFGATTRALSGWECRHGSRKPEARFRKYEIVRRSFGLQGSGDPSGCIY